MQIHKAQPDDALPIFTPSRSEFIGIRDLRYHVRHWGSEGAPKLFMLHGWMDMSASFQFLVDSMWHRWHVIAPDWRGFGLSQNGHEQTYWFPNYIADLEALLFHYSPDEPVNLLGHSMGGNISCVYAGVRPERVANLINLEGYGLPTARAIDAPRRYRLWLDQLRRPTAAKSYTKQAAIAALLQRINPRLTDARAQFLSDHWAVQGGDGLWEIRMDPAHRNSSPLLYRAEEALACWGGIAARTLWVAAEDTDIWHNLGFRRAAKLPQDESRRERNLRLKREKQFRMEFEERLRAIPHLEKQMISNAGHMLHHDQPEQVARVIEAFLLA